MASFNRVILVGNLTRDVELKYTSTQTAVTDVGMAVNDRRRTPNGDWVDDPVFVDVTLWGRTAEIASQYLNKGSSVLIEGRLKFDTWETDGQKRSKLRVVGERMQMLSPRSANGPPAPHSDGSAPQYSAAPGHPGAAEPPEDEIPF
jgi:single-strand DNA-binding protein